MVKTISEKYLIENYNHHLTVGDLKEFIEKYDLSDDAKVLVQRVEDKYFENHNWSVLLKDNSYSKGRKEYMTQYYPVWCCVKYKSDYDILFIDSHI